MRNGSGKRGGRRCAKKLRPTVWLAEAVEPRVMLNAVMAPPDTITYANSVSAPFGAVAGAYVLRFGEHLWRFDGFHVAERIGCDPIHHQRPGLERCAVCNQLLADKRSWAGGAADQWDHAESNGSQSGARADSDWGWRGERCVEHDQRGKRFGRDSGNLLVQPWDGQWRRPARRDMTFPRWTSLPDTRTRTGGCSGWMCWYSRWKQHIFLLERGAGIFADLRSEWIGGNGSDKRGLIADGDCERCSGPANGAEHCTGASGGVDPTTFDREFVVTGTASASAGVTPVVPTGVSAAMTGAGVAVNWNAVAGATEYTVQRAASQAGTYQSIGTVAGQTSFLDQAQPGVTYFYEVKATGGGTSGSSSPSPGLFVAPYGVTQYFFTNQFWTGTTNAGVRVPAINFNGGGRAVTVGGFNTSNAASNSSLFEGKIKTDLAGSYTFFANTDDDGYLWVNGQLVSVNGGSHTEQSPVVTIPITLAAQTPYDFVFLHNNRGGQWTMTMSWQVPTAGGTPGPMTIIDSLHLIPTPTPVPIPQQTTATATSGGVRLAWNSSGDTSSFAYLIQRCAVGWYGESNRFFRNGRAGVFGGAGLGIPASQTWGASSFTDASAAGNTAYVYRVGTILPNQTLPTVFGTTSAVVHTPATVSTSIFSGTLNVSLDALGDTATISTIGGTVHVSEAGSDVFAAPAAGVSALVVNGLSSGTQNVCWGRCLWEAFQSRGFRTSRRRA